MTKSLTLLLVIEYN